MLVRLRPEVVDGDLHGIISLYALLDDERHGAEDVFERDPQQVLEATYPSTVLLHSLGDPRAERQLGAAFGDILLGTLRPEEAVGQPTTANGIQTALHQLEETALNLHVEPHPPRWLFKAEVNVVAQINRRARGIARETAQQRVIDFLEGPSGLRQGLRDRLRDRYGAWRAPIYDPERGDLTFTRVEVPLNRAAIYRAVEQRYDVARFRQNVMEAVEARSTPPRRWNGRSTPSTATSTRCWRPTIPGVTGSKRCTTRTTTPCF